jgi:molybdopterin synthase catalytic subunit
VIRLTHDAIDSAEAVDAASSPGAGGVVTFLGTVRDNSQGKTVDHLVYQAYEPMAEAKLQEIADEAHQRWPLAGVAIVHRLGRVEVGEASVVIVVAAAHRAEAFDACRYLIDRIKEVVPIWKQEQWIDGSSQWAHPS